MSNEKVKTSELVEPFRSIAADSVIGKYVIVQPYFPDWEKKAEIYKKLRVFRHFINKSKELFPKLSNTELCDKTMQAEIDGMLKRWVNGDTVPELLELWDGKNKKRVELSLAREAQKRQERENESRPKTLLPSDTAVNLRASGTIVDDMEWIYLNLGISAETIDPKTAPSMGAHAYLKFIQENNDRISDFYTKTLTKLIPSRTQLENTGKFNDDGRDTLKLLEKLSGEIANSEG